MAEERAASEEAPKRRRTAWWAEILIAIAVVLVVVGIAIPSYNIGKANARRAEAKMNLHDIQLALERYAAGTGGMYPEFLLGGSAPHVEDQRNLSAQASDPLIQEGYLTEYPRNPFAVPQTVKAMQEKYNDPFRPGAEQSKYGYRFGEDYALMGQVLADFRYPKLPGQKMTQTNGIYYFADTEYPFWDIWPKGARKPKPFLPGEFFYKSFGDLKFASEIEIPRDRPILPKTIEVYMLGLYGAQRDKGMRVLGPEPDVFMSTPPKKDEKDWGRFYIPAWTRSTMTSDADGKYQGSPYTNDVPPDVDIEQFSYGHIYGAHDGIIYLLIPGYDTAIGESRFDSRGYIP